MNAAYEAERSKRNRRFNTRRLENEIDPDGIQLVVFHMIHNDVEMRTEWLVKMKGTMTPTRLWLDMSFKNWDILPEINTEEMPEGDA
jgi:hypothetical protein